jgi:hypothetical protein
VDAPRKAELVKLRFFAGLTAAQAAAASGTMAILAHSSYPTGTLTVTPKLHIISGFAVANRAYDGGVDASITANVSLTGGGSTSTDANTSTAKA